MKRFFLAFLVSILLFSVFCLLLPRQEHASQKVEALDDYIQQVMTEASIPGLAISVIRDNQVLLVKGFGLANIEREIPITINTPFNLASISKPILGISLLRLQDSGLLDIDRDINEYLPFVLDNPKLIGEKITLRHLASHSSGISDSYDFSAFGHNQDSSTKLKDYVEQRLSIKGDYYQDGRYYHDTEPGTRYRYSNLATGLAGLALETVAETDLNTFAKKEIFDPLGMINTSWFLSNLDQELLATPYELEICIPLTGICVDESAKVLGFAIGYLYDPPPSGKTLSPYPHYGFPDYPAGGLRSSIQDLTQLIHAVLNNGKENYKLMSVESYQEMFRVALPEQVATGKRFYWQDNGENIGHGGSNPGVLTEAYFNLENRNATMILMNHSADALTMWALNNIMDSLSSATDSQLKLMSP